MLFSGKSLDPLILEHRPGEPLLCPGPSPIGELRNILTPQGIDDIDDALHGWNVGG